MCPNPNHDVFIQASENIVFHKSEFLFWNSARTVCTFPYLHYVSVQIPLLDQHMQSSPAVAPEKLRHIELHEVIAQGKFGAVRRAINLEQGEVVAVKIMSIQVLTKELVAYFLRSETYKLSFLGKTIVAYRTRDLPTPFDGSREYFAFYRCRKTWG